jgi:hypothetical protein
MSHLGVSVDSLMLHFFPVNWRGGELELGKGTQVWESETMVILTLGLSLSCPSV